MAVFHRPAPRPTAHTRPRKADWDRGADFEVPGCQCQADTGGEVGAGDFAGVDDGGELVEGTGHLVGLHQRIRAVQQQEVQVVGAQRRQ